MKGGVFQELLSFKCKMQISFPYEIPINSVIPSFRALLHPLKWKQKLPISPGYHTFPKRRDPKDNEKTCLAFPEVSQNFVSAHVLFTSHRFLEIRGTKYGNYLCMMNSNKQLRMEQTVKDILERCGITLSNNTFIYPGTLRID